MTENGDVLRIPSNKVASRSRPQAAYIEFHARGKCTIDEMTMSVSRAGKFSYRGAVLKLRCLFCPFWENVGNRERDR